MDLVLMGIVFATAGMLPVQAAINARLDACWAHHPVLAAFVSFLVGTAALGVYLLVARVPVPSLPGQSLPWHWIGGIMGAAFVAIMAFSIPRLGAGAVISLALAGQLCAGLVLDHFGLVGLEVRSVSWPRLLGMVLVFGGVFLIRRF